MYYLFSRCKSSKEGRYSGDFCEKCPTCSTRCFELIDCVRCQMYKTGPLKKEIDCSTNCTAFLTKGVKKIEMDEQKDESICVFYDDENDCKFAYKYSEDKDVIKVYAQLKQECPPKIFVLEIVLGVIATIVFVGLGTLLLWKLLTTIHDRREFAKFEKERLNAQWNAVSSNFF